LEILRRAGKVCRGGILRSEAGESVIDVELLVGAAQIDHFGYHPRHVAAIDSAFHEVARHRQAGSRRPDQRVVAPGNALRRAILILTRRTVGLRQRCLKARLAEKSGGLVEREQAVAPKDILVVRPDDAVQDRIKNPCREFPRSYLEANRIAKVSREPFLLGGFRHSWGSRPCFWCSLPPVRRRPTRPALRVRNARATGSNQASCSAALHPPVVQPRAHSPGS